MYKNDYEGGLQALDEALPDNMLKLGVLVGSNIVMFSNY